MATTTHPEYNSKTEALEVADAFTARITGKTVLVTGVNRSGIGYSTARAFASHSPSLLIITGRSPEKIEESIDALRAEFPGVDCQGLRVDLSSQRSVRDAAAEVMSWPDVPTIDIIVNSAGVMGIPERRLSEDGIELHFATNHLGHWLFVCLIMSKVIKAAERNPRGATRIVNVSSASPQVSGMRWSDINFEKRNKDLPGDEQPNYEWFAMCGCPDIEDVCYVPLDGYNRSKVANVLFGIAANRRLFERYGVLSLAVHPGVIETELGRNMTVEEKDMWAELRKGVFKPKTLGAGAATSLVAALDPLLAQGVGESQYGSENWGSYLENCQISGEAHSLAVSSEEAEKLWGLSEGLVGEAFAW
ncbi:NAD(P)-binding protein [Aspergillus ibericus CBS 121593]|uniref:NAD(P)-binding protein n=1 Tax=Aspergillus ibericus CBS 121593 TaxID=1448316 RepID=A0A395H6T3_9EURO|nr:NAD(P)-binding protein [Aspergillus ibericus CBS 121593]RAL03641.1 NAD(P)-binding protein [Aspergillus ibericus CBS 121593]